MISYLIGKPLIHGTNLTLLVGGVGYEVKVSSKIIASASSYLTNDFELFVYTHVREDALSLFGFQTLAERSLFLLVLSVSGVGPAIALQIVAAGSDKVVEAVQQAQVGFFTNIPRVGKKLAQKIIIELSSKLGEMKQLQLEPLSEEASQLTESLLALGFDENRVSQVVSELNTSQLSLEQNLKKALQMLKKS